jgi:hypothetical protein
MHTDNVLILLLQIGSNFDELCEGGSEVFNDFGGDGLAAFGGVILDQASAFAFKSSVNLGPHPSRDHFLEGWVVHIAGKHFLVLFHSLDEQRFEHVVEHVLPFILGDLKHEIEGTKCQPLNDVPLGDRCADRAETAPAFE